MKRTEGIVSQKILLLMANLFSYAESIQMKSKRQRQSHCRKDCMEIDFVSEQQTYELIRVRMAAAILGVSKSKVYDMIHDGVITAYFIDGNYRLNRGDVLAFIDQSIFIPA